MAFPAGVITRQVIVGPFPGTAGEVVRGQVQVQCSISLKWAADGTVILPTPETILLDSDTGLGELTLPTIQAGFVTGPNNDVVADFYYTLTPILNSASSVPVNVLQMHLGYGDGTPYHPDFTTPIPGNGVVLYMPGAAGPAGPPGAPGAPGTPSSLSIGTVSTLPAGQPATATLTGGAPNQVLNLGIPAGPAGAGGGGQGVPTGGTTGQVLTKTDGVDFHTAWANNSAAGIPAGGLANQILQKVDGTDYNTQWVNVPISLPVGGATGQTLIKNSGTNGDASWGAFPAQHDLPVGGTTGQYLKKNSGTDRDVAWATLPTNGLPAGGTTGQFLKKNSGTDGDASFATFGVNDVAPGALVVVQKTGTTWPARPTARADVRVAWLGPYVDDPSEPPIITTAGTGGMLDGVDLRWRY